MKLKKLAAILLTVAMLAVCFVVPSMAASSSSISAKNVSGSTATFAFVVSAPEGVGAMEFNLSATGGSITSATASTGTLASNAGFYNWYIENAVPSVTITVTCSMSGSSMTLSYSGLGVYDDNADPVAGASSSGSATATAPAPTTPPTQKPTQKPTAAPTAAPTKPTEKPTEASTSANLKDLSVAGYSLSPRFSPNRTSYTVTIPKELTSLDVTATALNNDAKVTVTGDKNFTAGKPATIRIAVNGSDGTVKNYTIKTAFEGEEPSTEAPTVATPAVKVNLDTLQIKSLQDVLISFNPDVYDYNITVPRGTNALDITALADSVEGAIVDVKGADDLLAAGNKVIITVTDAEGNVSTYTINVAFAADAPVATEKKGGVPFWLIIIAAILFLIIGLVIGLLIGKKMGGGDDDYDGPSGFVFGGDADADEPESDDADAPISPYNGLNFASTGMSFGAPTFEPEPEPEPEVPSLNQPVYTQPEAAPLYTPPVPQPEAAPLYTPAAPAAPVAPVAPEAPAPAAPLYVAPVAPAPVAPVAPAAPVIPEAPVAPATPSGQSTSPLAPDYIAPTLPYEPGAVLTDESVVVQPAPTPIVKNPIEQCAD